MNIKQTKSGAFQIKDTQIFESRLTDNYGLARQLKFGVASEWVIYWCCAVETLDMLSGWREAMLINIFCQSQISLGVPIYIVSA